MEFSDFQIFARDEDFSGRRRSRQVQRRHPKAAAVSSTIPAQIKTETAPSRLGKSSKQTSLELNRIVEQIVSKRWAPLFVDPGLAGRDFSFDNSGELFEALSRAYPHLPPDLQNGVDNALAEEWFTHPPYSSTAFYSLKEGAPREPFWIPADFRARLGGDKQPHPFGGVYSAWLYAERGGGQKRVLASFPEIRKSFEDFEKTHWKLDPGKGDLFANRYLAALIGYARLAEMAKDYESAARASQLAAQASEALVAWWNRATGTLTNFNGSAQLDPFITNGDALSLRIAPHRHKIALFADLTPDVAALIRENALAAVEKVWETFRDLYATWYLTGEERQVHFGENFIDPPHLALGGFKALAWLRQADSGTLSAMTDLAFCQADLYHATKLALVLDSSTK